MAMLKLPEVYVAMLNDKPKMFGVRLSEQIFELIKEYPNEEKLIHTAVMRITEEDADQTSVKQWFLQMVKQKSKKPSQKPKIITNRNGRQVFTAKLDGRVITVRISDVHVDADTALLKVIDSLRSVADIDVKDE
jgi:hypothetical protein